MKDGGDFSRTSRTSQAHRQPPRQTRGRRAGGWRGGDVDAQLRSGQPRQGRGRRGGWRGGALIALLLAAAGLPAQPYDAVRVTGGESVEGGAYLYDLRCRDGSRRRAIEHWNLETNPPLLLKTCLPAAARGEAPRCKEGVGVRDSADWACAGR